MGEEVKGPHQHLLMDAVIVHQSYRVSVVHPLISEGSFSICAALTSRDESTTSIAVITHCCVNERTELEMEVGKSCNYSYWQRVYIREGGKFSSTLRSSSRCTSVLLFGCVHL